MIKLLYLNHDIAFPSPTLATAGRCSICRQALRAHVGRGGDEPRVRGMAERIRRREDDGGLAGPARAPLRDRRDRQRKLADPQQIVGRPASCKGACMLNCAKNRLP